MKLIRRMRARYEKTADYRNELFFMPWFSEEYLTRL